MGYVEFIYYERAYIYPYSIGSAVSLVKGDDAYENGVPCVMMTFTKSED